MKTAYYAMCIFISVCEIRGSGNIPTSGTALMDAKIVGNISPDKEDIFTSGHMTSDTGIIEEQTTNDKQKTGNIKSDKVTIKEQTIANTTLDKGTTEEQTRGNVRSEKGIIEDQTTTNITTDKGTIDELTTSGTITSHLGTIDDDNENTTINLGQLRKAKKGVFPYQISILKEGYHFCSGSLFHLNYVLTAAHCVFPEPYDVEVAAGGLNFNRIGLIGHKCPWQVRHVDEIIAHSNYVSATRENDIAVLYIRQGFELTSTVAPIGLKSPYVDVDANCVVSVWGETAYEGSSNKRSSRSSTLLYVEVPIMDHKHCTTLYTDRRVLINTLCERNFRQGGEEVCQGDSGGPVACGRFANAQFKEYVLTGVVSWSLDCAQPSRPGVYTDVSKYINWIHIVMRQTRSIKQSNSGGHFPGRGIILFFMFFILIYVYM